jgi:hypothetical protein
MTIETIILFITFGILFSFLNYAIFQACKASIGLDIKIKIVTLFVTASAISIQALVIASYIKICHNIN